MVARTLHRLAVLLAAGVLLVGPAPGSAVAGGEPGPASSTVSSDASGSIRDARGDVDVDAGDAQVTPAQADRIDLRRVTYDVDAGRSVRFRLRLVDVERSGRHRAWYGVAALAGPSSVFLAARNGGVAVLGGEGRRACERGRSRVSARRDVVRIWAPVDCLAEADRYRFLPLTLLEDGSGADLAGDRARRTARLHVR